MGSTRRGNARGLVALVAAVTFVPLGLFLWLGARLLQQDRALEKQQARDRLQTTGDLIVAALQRAIASSEQKVASGSEEWRDGAVLVTFFPDRVEASPRARLAYLPVVTSLHRVPAEQFRAAELLEFQSRNRAAAIAAYRHLAESPDARVRAGALLRLARNYASANRIDDARAAYAQLSVIDDIAEGDVPVGLAASWARCVLLERLGNDSALRDEAVRLQTDMLSGRWRITEPIYVTYMTDAERWAHAPPPDRRPERFADAVLQVWAEHSGEGPVASASSRYSVIVHGEPFTVLSQTSGKLRRALIAAAPFIASEWLKSASAVAVEQAAAFQIEDSGSGQRLFDAPRQPAPGTSVVRIARAQSELPWNVAVWSVDAPLSSGFQSRRRLLLTGFALLATLSLTAGWLIIRAVRRELAVARLQSDFVAAVSHEFRTPLTALRQFTAVLQEQRGLDEERRRVCYDAQARATDRLMRLVESVLDFGRMEAGARPYRFEPRDCSDMVQRVVEDFTAQPQMAERRVSFNRNGTVPVAADDEALSRALWNLLDNAVKYSPAGGPVEVSLHAANGHAAISVRDHGLGIAAHERQRIFAKFGRGEAARTHGIGGTGIGLAMVDHIVRAHGGRVDLESSPGRGSTFTIVIPLKG